MIEGGGGVLLPHTKTSMVRNRHCGDMPVDRLFQIYIRHKSAAAPPSCRCCLACWMKPETTSLQ